MNKNQYNQKPLSPYSGNKQLKKILVTGGLGFIGSNFIQYILDKRKNIEIIYNVDNWNTYSSSKWLNLNVKFNKLSKQDKKRYKFIHGDIVDASLYRKLPADIDAVVNFAAETHVDRSIIDAKGFIKSNILGLYNLIDFARKNSIHRFIHISTDEVYGSIISGSFKEESLLLPNNPYSATKASADLIIRSIIKTYGYKPIIVRPSNNFGPWQYPEKVIPLFITNAISGMPLPIYGDGKNVREWLFVRDTCDGLYQILNKGKTGEIYNLGGGHACSNIDLAQRILQKLSNSHKDMIKFIKDRPGHDKRYSIDSSKMFKETNWKPHINFDDALNETIKWYNENAYWWKSIKSNIEFKKYYKKQYGVKA
ncbi:MAG: dTDP-glucose 4,6-dehydratase [bacterium]